MPRSFSTPFWMRASILFDTAPDYGLSEERIGRFVSQRRSATEQDDDDFWERSGMGALAGDMKRHEFVLRYTLSHPGNHTTIVGTGNLGHLSSNLRTVQAGPLPPDLYEAAKAQLAQNGQYPEDN